MSSGVRAGGEFKGGKMVDEPEICPIFAAGGVDMRCIYGKCIWYQMRAHKCSVWVIANILNRELDDREIDNLLK